MDPYSGLPSSAFWKSGVTQENPYAINNIYKKKFDIKPNTQIATAGSCFGQHVGNHLRRNGYQVIDEEIAPPGLPDELHQKYGFSLYSARYGNIYTVKQLLQLAQEVAGERKPENFIWKKNGKYFDGLRPAVEPEGHDTEQEIINKFKQQKEKILEIFNSWKRRKSLHTYSHLNTCLMKQLYTLKNYIVEKVSIFLVRYGVKKILII